MKLYTKIESVHVVDLRDAVDEGDLFRLPTPSKTRCGLEIEKGAMTTPELDLEEKSCETCFRLVAHDEEETSADPDLAETAEADGDA